MSGEVLQVMVLVDPFCHVSPPFGEVTVMEEGAVVTLLTVTVTGADVVTLPAAS